MAVSAGLLTVLWLPVFVTDTVPRSALAVGLMPLGVGLIVASARKRRPSAVAALVCIAVLIISGLLAEAPTTAFVGQMPEWLSVIALTATLGWWAVGRALSPIGGRLVMCALTIGAGVNGTIGVAQLAFRVESGTFAARAGRASGLMLNPVFYGTFMIGVAGFWMAHSCQRHTRERLMLSGMLTFMAALSGGRAVLGAAVGCWLICLILWRRAALRPVAAGVVAYVLAEFFVRLVAPSTSSIERLSDGTAGGRLQMWRASLEAFAERPVLGWGPANAELAIMRHLPLSYVQEVHPNGTWTIWWDPHNALLTSLLSAGLIGTLALACFLVLSLRGTRDWPLLVAAATMAFTWSLQPFTVHTLPLAALLLGVGVRPRALEPPPDQIGAGARAAPGIARWQAGLLGAGAAIAVFVLSTTFVIDRSVDRGELDTATSAARLIPGDPWLRLYLADAYEIAYARGVGSDRSLARVREEAERAADLYPSSAHFERVADAAFAQDDLDAADQAIERALALEPWGPYALLRAHVIALLLGDDVGVGRSTAALCAISDHWCDAARERSEALQSNEASRG